MTHVQISRSREPIRLFKSDLLEFFTHIHPVVVLVIWLPVVAYSVAYAVVRWPVGGWPVHIPAGFVIGAWMWTLAEYLVHRFVFHFRPRTSWQERVSFLFHGVHHAQPACKTRLVMPPVVSIPLAVLFYAIFLLIGTLAGARHWVAPLFGGFVFGYLAYDMLHYSMHHIRLPVEFLRSMKRYHMQHHTATPEKRFGVSSPLWDVVFGTRPA